MLESKERLGREIGSLLESLRELAGGRYACVVDARGGVVFESPEPEDRETLALRRLLDERRPALFRIPDGMASGGQIEDVFEDWSHDELFLAFVNGRVGLVLACPEAEPLRERASQPLLALADRLLRFDESWRMDAQGRGLFFGRPRLDVVVVGRSSSGE